MNKILKKITTIVMAIGMMMSYVLPFKVVLAAEPAGKENYGRIQINGATTLEDANNASTITATFTNGTVTFSGTGLYSDGNNQVYASGNVTVTATPANNYTAELWSNGSKLNSTTTNINATASSFNNLDAIFNQASGNQNNTNAVANITISAGNGTYKITRPTPNGAQIVEENYDDMADFYINGSMWNPGDATISYNALNTDTKVTFTFETLWINRYYDDIVINGTPYKVSDYLDFDDRTAWLVANHGTQLISFDIPNVPKADSYNIVVKHGENNGKKYFATFLWTADPSQEYKIERDNNGDPILDANGKYKYILDANGNKILGEDYIGHSKLEFVKAVYEVAGTTYTVTEKDLEGKLTRAGKYLSASSTDGFLNYGVMADVNYDDGSLTLPGGAEVTMRIVPEYGYQVTSVNGGGKFTTTDTGVSEFTVVVPEGTAGYFNATVEKVDNTVTATSEKIKAGEIELGEDAATDIKSGTVRLSVEDVELSKDKITNFEEKASEAGNYKITNYLDINLNKVLYRGSSENVWPEQIHHLSNKALITLQLEEGVDASNIVIVHNIDDGDEFEIIEIESYDPETNTITFYTDSFSNYAIATKTETKNPKTGDTYTNLIIVLGVSLIGLLAMILYIKKRKVNE